VDTGRKLKDGKLVVLGGALDSNLPSSCNFVAVVGNDKFVAGERGECDVMIEREGGIRFGLG
jgi:hypothetical protein